MTDPWRDSANTFQHGYPVGMVEQPTVAPKKRSAAVVVLVSTIALVLVAVAGIAVWLAVGSKSTGVSGASSGSHGAKTATVAQYAGVLGEAIGQYRTAMAEYQTDCYQDGDATGCGLDIGQLSVTASVIEHEIQDVESAKSSSYLGQPPASIAALVASTKADATKVWRLTQPPNDPASGWQAAVDDLDNDCAAWAPYLA